MSSLDWLCRPEVAQLQQAVMRHSFLVLGGKFIAINETLSFLGQFSLLGDDYSRNECVITVYPPFLLPLSQPVQRFPQRNSPNQNR